MRARLIQVAKGRPPASTALGLRALEIGRDAKAGLRIDNENVSRRHARIHREGGRHVLSDLGSVNGTFLNGDPLPGPVALRDGDEIELAGEVSLVYRVEAFRPGLWLAALAGVVLLVAGVWLVSEQLRRRHDPVWVAAVELAREAIAAGLDARPYDNLEKALRAAGEITGGSLPARIVIAGSLYLAGNVLALHRGEMPSQVSGTARR